MLQAPVSDKQAKPETSRSGVEREPEQLKGLMAWGGRHHPVAGMQQAFGNQAALQMLRGQQQRLPAVSPVQGGVLQRKCACGNAASAAGTCAECQEKQEMALQTKLRISEPGDEYEREADRIAEQVMRMPDPSIQRQVESENKDEEIIQRKATPKPTPLTSDSSPGEIPPIVHNVLNSPGQPLDPETRTFMESRFGYDFSQVRIHTDATAAESSQAVNASAYTINNHIAFEANQYQPHTLSSRRLLAHELVHIIQQENNIHSKIQRSPGSPAGGCGICYGNTRDAGTAVHSVVRKAFIDQYGSGIIHPEFPLLPSPSDENGRLDLAILTGNRIGIGEIKPANAAGLFTGDLDLFWYEEQLRRLGFEVGRLRIPPPLQSISFTDPLARDCPATQALFVDPPVHGIYTYWCEPDFSILRSQCRCEERRRRVSDRVTIPATERSRERESFRESAGDQLGTAGGVAVATVVTAVAGRALWRHFWRAVATRFALRGAIAVGLAAADGPLPFGELIDLGLAVGTAIEIFVIWDALWREADRIAAQEA